MLKTAITLLAVMLGGTAVQAADLENVDQVIIKAVFAKVCTAEAAQSYPAMRKLGPKFCACSADVVAPQLTIDEVIHRTVRADEVVKAAFHKCLESTIAEAVHNGTLTQHDFE